MRKLHQNIFYYYKGQHENEGDIERQMENNATKALINVLENINPSLQIAFGVYFRGRFTSGR